MDRLEVQAQLREELAFLRSELQSGMLEGLRNEFAILKKDLFRELRYASKDMNGGNSGGGGVGAGGGGVASQLHRAAAMPPIGLPGCQAKGKAVPQQSQTETGPPAEEPTQSPAWQSMSSTEEAAASSHMVRFRNDEDSDMGNNMNSDEASIASEQLKAGSRFLKRGLLRRQNTPWVPPRLTRVKSGVSEFVSRKLSRERLFPSSASTSTSAASAAFAASRRRVSEASVSTEEETTASNGSGTDPTSSGPMGIRLAAGHKWQAELGRRMRQVSVVAESTLSDMLPETTCAASLRRFIFSLHFDYLSCLFVIFNAVLLGVQTDWQARHVSLADPVAFYILEVVLCLAFLLEVSLRAWAYGKDFFAPVYRWWHAFDCALLVQQVFELCWSTYQEQTQEAGVQRTTNLSILRMTRILRMIRVMRLVRILRLIGELRMLIISIVGSLRALFWAMLLLTLLLYVMSIYVTQLVLDHRLDATDSDSTSTYDQQLVDYYGSFGDTILSLYLAVTGGVDWGDIMMPVRSRISVWAVPFFMLYVSFVLLCMLNVITGAFVDSALAASKKDQSSFIVNSVYQAFTTYDANRSGRLNWSEFQEAIHSIELQQVFSALDLDQSEAASLFMLLDVEESGHISAEAFAHGVTRLHGPAKAIELSILMHETARQQKELGNFIARTDASLKLLAALLAVSGTNGPDVAISGSRLGLTAAVLDLPPRPASHAGVPSTSQANSRRAAAAEQAQTPTSRARTRRTAGALLPGQPLDVEEV